MKPPCLTGVFGGTFDPPHLGHLILACESLAQLGLDRLLWVLTPAPPHKPTRPITPVAERLEMLQRAIADEPRFEICEVEIGRPSPQYTAETLRLLKAENPGQGLVFLMGGDSLRALPDWREPHEILRLCQALGVMRRPNDRVDLPVLEKRLPGLSAKVRMVDVPLLQISSSQVRQRVAAGRPFRYYLHPRVYEYVCQAGLYLSDASAGDKA
ncbi:MAG: nicotinate-nucleotide adenylyltransferase [Anaerolineales bacterium]|nr:nicotinate-nucleotide adenylyltransferase [Anaerolineales bacterium]